MTYVTVPLLFSSGLGDSIGRKLGWRWAPRIGPGRRDKKFGFEVVPPREASVKLANRLVSTLREDNFLVLRLRDKSARKAAAIMNALIRRYVDEAATQKLGPSSLRHHEDGSVTIEGEEVDDPEEYKGEPIPGGPSDPDAPPDPAMVGEEDEDASKDDDSDDKESSDRDSG